MADAKNTPPWLAHSLTAAERVERLSRYYGGIHSDDAEENVIEEVVAEERAADVAAERARCVRILRNYEHNAAADADSARRLGCHVEGVHYNGRREAFKTAREAIDQPLGGSNA